MENFKFKGTVNGVFDFYWKNKEIKKAVDEFDWLISEKKW